GVGGHTVGVKDLASSAERQLLVAADLIEMFGLDMFEHIAADGVDAVQTPIFSGDIDHARLNLVALAPFVVERMQVESGFGSNGEIMDLGHRVCLLGMMD